MLSPVPVPVRRYIAPLLLVVLLGSAIYMFTLNPTRVKGAGTTHTFPKRVHAIQWKQKNAPSDAQCRIIRHFPCYSPQEMQKAYNLTPLLEKGYIGKGQTIVIIDSFGSPTALADLKQFDKDFGLPDPPSFQVLAPLGTVPFDPTNDDQFGWAIETSLDVQWAHAMAPGASIVLLTSPVSETEGVQGMPEFLKLEQYALDHHLGNIISQSWGTTENTLFTPDGQKVFQDFEAFYERAARAGVTVLASSGDGGSANLDVNNKTIPFPTVIYPASSPWVTAVGGTSLTASTSGNYQSENAWNGSGGGISQHFAEPSYQQALPASGQQLLKGHRGIPDIAYNADPGVPVFLGFDPRADQRGYSFIGGTSAGAPQWAGLIADANQLAGHPVGFLNPKLYKLGTSKQAATIFHDITCGNNAQGSVPGFSATPSWDLVTGWGTPIAAPLIQALVH